MSQPVSRWQCAASDSKYSTCTSELAAQNDHRHQTCQNSTQPTHCTTDSLAQLHTTIIPDNVELCNTDSIHKADTARPTALARRSRPRSGSDSSRVSERPRTTVSVLEHCIPVSSADARRHLRSANRHLLAVPRFPLNTYGRRAFSVAGPMTWNSLPDFIRDPTSSTDCFMHLLKTYLFACY